MPSFVSLNTCTGSGLPVVIRQGPEPESTANIHVTCPDCGRDIAIYKEERPDSGYKYWLMRHWDAPIGPKEQGAGGQPVR